MIFAATLTVLALAGAPAATPVVCNPQIANAAELGVTYSDGGTIVNGQFVPGTLDRIQLGGLACGAILYTSASQTERAAIRRLNPGVNFDQLVGVGLQVALHEAEHVALNSGDECLVEKTARAKVDGLISSLGDPGRVPAEEAAATASDAALPAAYHGC